MFTIRRLFKLALPFRRFGDDFENVFKTYLQQAEEIERKAKAKAKVELEAQASLKAKEQPIIKEKPKEFLSPLDEFLHSSQIISKLETAKDPIELQTCLEETLLTLNRNYYQQKNLIENPLKSIDLLLKLKKTWIISPQIKSKGLTFSSILRSIWSKPLTPADDDFGDIQRITKEGTIKHSPFIYGPLNNQMYCDLVQGVGDVETGVRLIRRVLDHMAHYNHIPSQDLVMHLVEECISGKWPRALYTVITYSCKQNATIPHRVWVTVLNYYRYNQEFFYRIQEILSLALKNGANPCFELIHLYIDKFFMSIDRPDANDDLSHELLLKMIKDAIITNSSTPEEKSEKLSNFTMKYLKFLISIREIKEAHKMVMKILEEENYSLESIEVCFKAQEELKDSFKALRLYKMITAHPNFVYTPKIIVAILRMCSVLGESALEIITEIQDLIVKDKKLCTPFAVNTIIIAYSVTKKWDNVVDFMSNVFHNNVEFNRYTGPTIRKMIENCHDNYLKAKLSEQAAKADYISSKDNKL